MSEIQFRNEIQHILSGEKPDRYNQLAKAVCSYFQMNEIRIQRIYLSRSEYEDIAAWKASDTVSTNKTYEIQALGHPNLGRLIVGMEKINDEVDNELGYISTILAKQFQIDWMSNLVRRLAEPVEWTENESQYFNDLALLCRQAAAAAHIAIREERDGQLIATAWNSHEIKEYRDNLDSIPGRSKIGKIIYPKREDDRVHYHGGQSEVVVYMRRAMKYDFLETVVSMPINVQGERVGIINFAYDHSFSLSPLMKSGLDMLSNVIGTAIRNYRLRDAIEMKARKILWSGRQALNYELMQGFRHWAGHALDDLGSSMDVLSMENLERVSVEDRKKAEAEIDNSLTDLHNAMQNMENLSRNYRLEGKTVSLKSAFFSAAALLDHEIKRDGITVTCHSPRDRLFGNEDALRAVFLNLMLNSIQAQRSAKTRSPTISLTISSERARVYFTYVDNGPGLKLGPLLRRPDDVWLPETTTKKNGTGFGMAMVRQVIQNMHGGEVNLLIMEKQKGFGLFGFVEQYGFKEGGIH